MGRLQGSCSEIPALTGGTQDLHARITTFILEAQQHAAQLGVAAAPASAQDFAAAAAAMVGARSQHVLGCGHVVCLACMRGGAGAAFRRLWGHAATTKRHCQSGTGFVETCFQV